MLQKCGKLANVGNNFQLKSNGSFLILVILSLCDNMCSSKFNPHYFLGLRGPLKVPLFPSRLQPFHLLFLPPSNHATSSQAHINQGFRNSLWAFLCSIIWSSLKTVSYQCIHCSVSIQLFNVHAQQWVQFCVTEHTKAPNCVLIL